MLNISLKYKAFFKAVTVLVASLFFLNTLAWAYPDRGRVRTSQDTISVESIFKPLVDRGITVSAAMRFEMLAGLRMLSRGMTLGAVNGYLVETSTRSEKVHEPMVEFLSASALSEGGIKAAFRVRGHTDLVFDVVYQDGSKDGMPLPKGESEVMPLETTALGELDAENIFRAGDRIVITIRTPEDLPSAGTENAPEPPAGNVTAAGAAKFDAERFYLNVMKPAFNRFRDEARAGTLTGDELLEWANKNVKPFAPGLSLADLGLSGKKAGMKELRSFGFELVNRALIGLGLFLDVKTDEDILAGEIRSVEEISTKAGNKAKIFTVHVFGEKTSKTIILAGYFAEPDDLYDSFRIEAPEFRKKWALAKKNPRYTPNTPRSLWNFFEYVMLKTYGDKADDDTVLIAKNTHRAETLSCLDCLAHFKRVWGREADLCDDEDFARLARSILREDSPLLAALRGAKSAKERLNLAKSIIDLETTLNGILRSPYLVYSFNGYMRSVFQDGRLQPEGVQPLLARLMLGYMPGQGESEKQLSDQEVASAWIKYSRTNCKNFSKMSDDLGAAADKAYKRDFLSLEERAAMTAPPAEEKWFDPENFYRDIYRPSVSILRGKQIKNGLTGKDVIEWAERVIKPVASGYNAASRINPEESVTADSFASVIRAISDEVLVPKGLLVDFKGRDLASAWVVERSYPVSTPAGNTVTFYEAREIDGGTISGIAKADRVIIPAGIDRENSGTLETYKWEAKRLPPSYGLKHPQWAFGDWMRLRYLAKLQPADDPVGIMRQPIIDAALSSVDMQIYARSVLGREIDVLNDEDRLKLCGAILKPGSKRLAHIRETTDPVSRDMWTAAILDMEMKLNSIRRAKSPAYCALRMMVGTMEPRKEVKLDPRQELANRAMFSMMAVRLFSKPTDDMKDWTEYLRGKAADIKSLGEEIRKAADDVYKTEFYSNEERAAVLAKKGTPSSAVIMPVKRIVAPGMSLAKYALRVAPWLEEAIFFALPMAVLYFTLGFSGPITPLVMAAVRAGFYFAHHETGAGAVKEGKREILKVTIAGALLPVITSFIAPSAGMAVLTIVLFYLAISLFHFNANRKLDLYRALEDLSAASDDRSRTERVMNAMSKIAPKDRALALRRVMDAAKDIFDRTDGLGDEGKNIIHNCVLLCERANDRDEPAMAEETLRYFLLDHKHPAKAKVALADGWIGAVMVELEDRGKDLAMEVFADVSDNWEDDPEHKSLGDAFGILKKVSDGFAPNETNTERAVKTLKLILSAENKHGYVSIDSLALIWPMVEIVGKAEQGIVASASSTLIGLLIKTTLLATGLSGREGEYAGHIQNAIFQALRSAEVSPIVCLMAERERLVASGSKEDAPELKVIDGFLGGMPEDHITAIGERLSMIEGSDQADDVARERLLTALDNSLSGRYWDFRDVHDELQGILERSFVKVNRTTPEGSRAAAKIVGILCHMGSNRIATVAERLPDDSGDAESKIPRNIRNLARLTAAADAETVKGNEGVFVSPLMEHYLSPEDGDGEEMVTLLCGLKTDLYRIIAKSVEEYSSYIGNEGVDEVRRRLARVTNEYSKKTGSPVPDQIVKLTVKSTARLSEGETGDKALAEMVKTMAVNRDLAAKTFVQEDNRGRADLYRAAASFTRRCGADGMEPVIEGLILRSIERHFGSSSVDPKVFEQCAAFGRPAIAAIGKKLKEYESSSGKELEHHLAINILCGTAKLIAKEDLEPALRSLEDVLEHALVARNYNIVRASAGEVSGALLAMEEKIGEERLKPFSYKAFRLLKRLRLDSYYDRDEVGSILNLLARTGPAGLDEALDDMVRAAASEDEKERIQFGTLAAGVAALSEKVSTEKMDEVINRLKAEYSKLGDEENYKRTKKVLMTGLARAAVKMPPEQQKKVVLFLFANDLGCDGSSNNIDGWKALCQIGPRLGEIMAEDARGEYLSRGLSIPSNREALQIPAGTFDAAFAPLAERHKRGFTGEDADETRSQAEDQLKIIAGNLGDSYSGETLGTLLDFYSASENKYDLRKLIVAVMARGKEPYTHIKGRVVTPLLDEMEDGIRSGEDAVEKRCFNVLKGLIDNGDEDAEVKDDEDLIAALPRAVTLLLTLPPVSYYDENDAHDVALVKTIGTLLRVNVGKDPVFLEKILAGLVAFRNDGTRLALSDDRLKRAETRLVKCFKDLGPAAAGQLLIILDRKDLPEKSVLKDLALGAMAGAIDNAPRDVIGRAIPVLISSLKAGDNRNGASRALAAADIKMGGVRRLLLSELKEALKGERTTDFVIRNVVFGLREYIRKASAEEEREIAELLVLSVRTISEDDEEKSVAGAFHDLGIPLALPYVITELESYKGIGEDNDRQRAKLGGVFKELAGDEAEPAVRPLMEALSSTGVTSKASLKAVTSLSEAIEAVSASLGYEKVSVLIPALVAKVSLLSGKAEDKGQATERYEAQKAAAKALAVIYVKTLNLPPAQANIFISYFTSLRSLIQNVADCDRVRDEVITITNLCNGVEERMIRAMEELQPILHGYPSSYSKYIKPIIFNQTVGSFLCLEAMMSIYGRGGIETDDDLGFIRDFVIKNGVRSADLLENFIVVGLNDGSISKPVSLDKELIGSYIKDIGYPLTEIFKAYKSAPDKAESLKKRCDDIHKAILSGDASAFEEDPFFSAMLLYVFPPEVTANRESYAQIYSQRPDRPKDTAAVRSELSRAGYFEIKTGSYTLKDASKPIDNTPWNVIVRAVSECNSEKDIREFGDKEKAALGRELLEAWEKGGLYKGRDHFMRSLYAYFRFSRRITLPERISTLKDVYAHKEFVGDTMRDLIRECMAAYREADAGKYDHIRDKMLKTRIDNPNAAAKKVLAVLKNSPNEGEAVTRLSSALRMDDPQAVRELYLKVKDSPREKIASILADFSFKHPEGKEATVVAQLLQGSDYKAMQGEVANKLVFNEGMGSVKLRMEISKRKAHGVAGLNMGVCVAPDEALWNNPNFMNAILFDNFGIAQGGMHILIIEEGGKKYLTLPGINPSTSLILKVDVKQLYDKMIEYAMELCEEMKCDAVLIPEERTIHSNRSQVQGVIGSRGYGVKTLEKSHVFSHHPSYSFGKAYVAYENKAARTAEGPAIALVMKDARWENIGLTEAQHRVINEAWAAIWDSGYDLPEDDAIYRDVRSALDGLVDENLPIHIHGPPDGKYYDTLYRIASERGVTFPPRGEFRLVTHPGTYRNEKNKPRSCNLLIPASELARIRQLKTTNTPAYDEWLEHEVSHIADRAARKRGMEKSEETITKYHGLTKFMAAVTENTSMKKDIQDAVVPAATAEAPVSESVFDQDLIDAELKKVMADEKDATEKFLLLLLGALGPIRTREKPVSAENVRALIEPVNNALFEQVARSKSILTRRVILERNLVGYANLVKIDEPSGGMCDTLEARIREFMKKIVPAGVKLERKGYTLNFPGYGESVIHAYTLVHAPSGDFVIDAALGQFLPEYSGKVVVASESEYQPLLSEFVRKSMALIEEFGNRMGLEQEMIAKLSSDLQAEISRLRAGAAFEARKADTVPGVPGRSIREIYRVVRQKLDPVKIERVVQSMPSDTVIRPQYIEMLKRRSGLLHTEVTISEVFDKLGVVKGDKVLEIGPGQSIMPILCALMGANVTAVEFSEHYRARLAVMIDIFKDDIAAAGGAVTIIGDDINSPGVKARLGDSSFDKVICLDVINNTADRMGGVLPGADTVERGIRDKAKQKELIDTMVRVVKKSGGTVYFSKAGDDPSDPDGFVAGIEAAEGRILQRYPTHSIFIPEEKDAIVYKLAGTGNIGAGDVEVILPSETHGRTIPGDDREFITPSESESVIKNVIKCNGDFLRDTLKRAGSGAERFLDFDSASARSMSSGGYLEVYRIELVKGKETFRFVLHIGHRAVGQGRERSLGREENGPYQSYINSMNDSGYYSAREEFDALQNAREILGDNVVKTFVYTTVRTTQGVKKWPVFSAEFLDEPYEGVAIFAVGNAPILAGSQIRRDGQGDVFVKVMVQRDTKAFIADIFEKCLRLYEDTGAFFEFSMIRGAVMYSLVGRAPTETPREITDIFPKARTAGYDPNVPFKLTSVKTRIHGSRAFFIWGMAHSLVQCDILNRSDGNFGINSLPPDIVAESLRAALEKLHPGEGDRLTAEWLKDYIENAREIGEDDGQIKTGFREYLKRFKQRDGQTKAMPAETPKGTIRPAADADAESLRRLSTAIKGSEPLEPSIVKRLLAADTDHFGDLNVFYVYEESGEVKGYIGGRMLPGRGLADISHLAVAEDARGKGVGTTLLKAFMNKAKEDKCERFYTDASPASAGIFKNAGFSRIEGVRENDLIDYYVRDEDEILGINATAEDVIYTLALRMHARGNAIAMERFMSSGQTHTLLQFERENWMFSWLRHNSIEISDETMNRFRENVVIKGGSPEDADAVRKCVAVMASFDPAGYREIGWQARSNGRVEKMPPGFNPWVLFAKELAAYWAGPEGVRGKVVPGYDRSESALRGKRAIFDELISLSAKMNGKSKEDSAVKNRQEAEGPRGKIVPPAGGSAQTATTAKTAPSENPYDLLRKLLIDSGLSPDLAAGLREEALTVIAGALGDDKMSKNDRMKRLMSALPRGSINDGDANRVMKAAVRNVRLATVAGKLAARTPVEAGLTHAEDAALKAERRDEADLLVKTREYLAKRPVNVFIDLSVIPRKGLSAEQAEAELRSNMRAIAYLIAAHNAKGLEVRYILEHDADASYKAAAESMLKEEIGKLSVDTKPLLERVTGEPYKTDNAIDVSLKAFDKVTAMKEGGAALGDNQFVVALKDDAAKSGAAIPNYSAAMAVGLSLAALREAKEHDKTENYEKLKAQVLGRVASIFERFGLTHKNAKFSADELELMVTGASLTKFHFALTYALPPAIKVSIERLRFFHEALELLLQAA